ncbi:hypothetical protein AcetOrient_orf01197 [Acetobacter orientalis]|uniref:Uncharacterized protein n=1 Tax=Acetobacter orientalis TaxID=146474 RepID=A0A2Z5ZFG3_9PROT|nr:hypothetical protein AcetOrient_orf01197 [Acetobacter orientalis]
MRVGLYCCLFFSKLGHAGPWRKKSVRAGARHLQTLCQEKPVALAA